MCMTTEPAKPLLDAVDYVRVHCPRCGSPRPVITHTGPQERPYRIRYHRCREKKCRALFKSVETVA